MRTCYFLLIVLLPLLSKGQAYLGSTLEEIKSRHPDKTFTVDDTNRDFNFASTPMPYGIFVYYFDKMSGISSHCLQIPYDMKSLNVQIEIYNNKYVVVSETSWKAYLEGGAVMKIELIYDKEYKSYLFRYSPNESSSPATQKPSPKKVDREEKINQSMHQIMA